MPRAMNLLFVLLWLLPALTCGFAQRSPAMCVHATERRSWRFVLGSGINDDPAKRVLHCFHSSSPFRHKARSASMAHSPMRATHSSSPLATSHGAAARRALLDWGVVRGRRSPQVAVSSSSEVSPPPVRHGTGRPRGRGRVKEHGCPHVWFW